MSDEKIMTDDELQAYAKTLMQEHARDVEYLSIFEMADEHLGHEITDEDAKKVNALMARARVTVEFPDGA